MRSSPFAVLVIVTTASACVWSTNLKERAACKIVSTDGDGADESVS